MFMWKFGKALSYLMQKTCNYVITLMTERMKLNQLSLLEYQRNKSMHSKPQESFLYHPGFGTIQLLGFVCNYGPKLIGWLDIFKVISSIYYHMISMILPSIIYLSLTNAGSWGNGASANWQWLWGFNQFATSSQGLKITLTSHSHITGKGISMKKTKPLW